MEFYSFGLMRFVVLLISVKVITSDFLRIPPSASDVQNGPKVLKCAKDREITFLSSTGRNVNLPECMPDGILYRKEQCNRELDYCWCVDQVDGRPIDGSVVRGSYPKQVKCDAAPEKTSEGEEYVVWRSDDRCGASYLIDGKPSECDPNGKRPCCSDWGWCGNTPGHCECEGCVSFKKAGGLELEGKKWRPDGRCGPTKFLNGRPGECDPYSNFPCCSLFGWCGIKEGHCECPECMDYRIVKQLLSKASTQVPVGVSVEDPAQVPAEKVMPTKRSRIRFGVPMKTANSIADRKSIP